MNFDKESKSEEKKFFFGGGGGGGGGVGEGGEREERERVGGRRRAFQPKKNPQQTIGIRLFFVLMFYIKFQVPSSSGSLVLTQTKGVTDR